MFRPASKTAFYGVHQGRQTGVFLSWAECNEQIKGFPDAKYKKFSNAAAAEAYVAGTTTTQTISVASSSTITEVTARSGPAPDEQVAKGKKRAHSPTIEDESGWDVVYSDGACKGNGQPGSVAGVGVWWGPNDPRNIAERCPGDQTNNRAELIAIVRVLETTPITKNPLLIKTDSQYCINCFKSWLPKWKKNNWHTSNGAAVKNAPIIRYLSALLDERGFNGQKVHLKYVKGHSGDIGNDGADAQANIGATRGEVPEQDWAELEQAVKERMEQAVKGMEQAVKERMEQAVEERMEQAVKERMENEVIEGVQEDDGQVPLIVVSAEEDVLVDRTKIRRLKSPVIEIEDDVVEPPVPLLPSSTPRRLANTTFNSTTTARRTPRSPRQRQAFSTMSPRTSSPSPQFKPNGLLPSSNAKPSKSFNSTRRKNDSFMSSVAQSSSSLPPPARTKFSSVSPSQTARCPRRPVTPPEPLSSSPEPPKSFTVRVVEDEVNYMDYADCVLDEKDLAKELSD